MIKIQFYFLFGLTFISEKLCYAYYDVNNQILLFVENIINDSFLIEVVVQTNDEALDSMIVKNKINEYKNDENEFKEDYLIGLEYYFVTCL